MNIMSDLKSFFVGGLVTTTDKEIITTSFNQTDLRDEIDLKEYSEFVNAMRGEVSKKGVRFLNKVAGWSSSAVSGELEPTSSYTISAAINLFPNGTITGFNALIGSNRWYNGTLKKPATSYILTSTLSRTFGNHNNWPQGTTTTSGPNNVNLGTQRQFIYQVSANPTQNALAAGAEYSVTITSTQDANRTATGIVSVECQQIF